MTAADRVPELLTDVLSGRKTDPAILVGLTREKTPEGLFHEYKRGQWLNIDRAQELRRYVSGFANAEGGVLIIGIVGGEPSQGPDAWTFEAPACPDPAGGWDEWLARILSDVSSKTRVAWQVVPVEGKDVVLVAANRAEALIRVYEKPRLVCYLRVAGQTVPIEETLFADLALGRRAKPDLAIEQLTVVGGTDANANAYRASLSLLVHNQGLLWVPDLSVSWIGYQRSGPVVSASLKREIDLRSTTRSDRVPVVAQFLYSGRGDGPVTNVQDGVEVGVKPFELRKFTTTIGFLPPTPETGLWAWYGAVVVLPRNGSPLWAQLAIHGEATLVLVKKGWPLLPGATPTVAWFEGNGTPSSPEAFFGPTPPATIG